MEEDIKILDEYLDKQYRKYVNSKRFRFLKAIENIVNRVKEDEEVIDKATELLGDLKLSKNREGYEVMSKEDWKQYFRKKVQNERNEISS